VPILGVFSNNALKAGKALLFRGAGLHHDKNPEQGGDSAQGGDRTKSVHCSNAQHPFGAPYWANEHCEAHHCVK
jgi:hypothetical protein